jgi:hypothetical protein
MKKLYLSILITAGVFATITNTMAQSSPVWTRSMSSIADTASVFPVKTELDAFNNIYVLSTYYKSIGSGIYNSKIYLNKYSDAGALLWSLVYDNNGSGRPRGFDMAVDYNGNSYIAGGFIDPLVQRPLLMKVNSGGGVVWMRDSTTAFSIAQYDQLVLRDDLLYVSSYSGVALFDTGGNERWSHSINATRMAVDYAFPLRFNRSAEFF